MIRAFDRIDYERNRFDIASLDLMDVSIKVNKLMALMMPAIIIIMNFATIAILWFGGIRINQGDLQVGCINGLHPIWAYDHVFAGDGNQSSLSWYREHRHPLTASMKFWIPNQRSWIQPIPNLLQIAEGVWNSRM